MKPTLKEVKEYFKDAETIKCERAWSTTSIEDYNPNIRSGVHEWFGGYWMDIEKDSRKIWSSDKGFAEIITYKNNTQMRTLTRDNYKRIHDIACSTWKPKLQDWYGNKFAIQDEINIKDSEYKLMRKACTDEQNDLFDEIFGKDGTLEVGKWYKGSHRDSIYCLEEVLNRDTNPHKSYGINGAREWVKSEGRDLYDCREATEEEVESALIKEAEKRGFIEGVKVKAPDGDIFILDKFWHIDSYDKIWFEGKEQNGVIFKNGEWAQIIETVEEKTYKLSKLTLNKFSKLLQEYYKENDTPATHLFMYSEGQNDIGDNKTYYKGREYSEMRGFEHGFKSNWDDMRVLGVGTNKDISTTR